ncbi:restriction endonuclease subunit S [Weissella paramesenteroides]|uniref:restriction endonuclease subunit S n=1 Tax=Weissella paramesenteroides TaxID=1249 RepID=UPI0024027F24|nr:restriction endonuclease subunit S [Weissella paramesenteroides]MDF8366228.1 restriction endonuclease subunit S [Weissella paramesenteroides]
MGMQPKLRFKGFTDDWEKRKFDQMMSVNSGKDYKHLEKGNIPVYGTGGYMLSVNAALSYDDGIGIGRKGTINKPYVLYAPYWTVDTLFYAVPNKGYDLNFVFNLFQLINWEKYDESTGVPSLSKKTINQIQQLAPKFNEQVKIGNLFSLLDNLITVNQRKVDLLKKKKTGYLQKLFPKNGQNNPELRFKGYTDAWEKRKLGDYSDVRDGTHASPKYVSSGHPMVTSKNLTQSGLDMTDISYLSDFDFNEINKRSKVDIGDILFGMIGTIGNPVVVNRDDFAIKNVALIKEPDNPNILNKWLIQYLKSPSFKAFIQRKNAGGTQKFIALGLIRDMNVMVPDFSEQSKIGELLKSVDNLITVNQRKVDLLKKEKRALLQKMFV